MRLTLLPTLSKARVLLGVMAALVPLSASAAPNTRPYTPSELQEVETPTEAKIRAIRDQEIKQLRIALSRRNPENRRADLFFRLSEIYIEAYRSYFLLEGRAHDKRLERKISDPFIDHAHSRPFLHSAVKASEEIIELNIAYDKLDRVYYFLGYSYNELGNTKKSDHYFAQIIQKFPKSEVAGQAYREMGDAAYDAGQYQKAVGSYEAAIPRVSPADRARLNHKLAWCYYRTKNSDRAVATMKLAIRQANESGEKYLSLKEEALRDMALFMTESGKVDEAIAYFKETAGDKEYYPKALERLGKQFEKNAEPGKATQVYESLLQTSPDSEEAFRVLVKLVDLDLRRGRFKESLARVAKIKVPNSNDSETQLAAQNLRAMVRRTATENHDKFRKSSEKAQLLIAESFYATYLDQFLAKDDPRGETPEIEMYLAEVKRDLGKSDEASALYRKVIDSGDKRYAKEASALWTASLSEAIKRNADKQAASGVSVAKKSDPSDLEKQYISASDKMMKVLGDTNEGRETALRSAQVLAGYTNTQDDAMERAEKIVEEYPKSLQALTAAKLWIQIRSDRLGQSKGPDELRETLAKIKENSNLMAFDQKEGQGKLRAQMEGLETKLLVTSISKSEKSSDHLETARGYETFAARTTDRDAAEKAYASAMSNYVRAQDYAAVDRVVDYWLKRYPGSAKAVDSVRLTGTHYLVIGQFDRAGKVFASQGAQGKDPQSLDTSARLFEGTGDIGQAQETWVKYLNVYQKEESRFAIALQLAKSHDLLKQESLASKYYGYCLGGPVIFEAECGSRLADLYLRNQELAQARKYFQRVATLGDPKKKKSGSSPFIAYARFRLAELKEKESKFSPLALPEASLKRGLEQRLGFLEPLSKAYLAAVEAGGPWGIAALNRLAAWAWNFADEVDQIDPPAGSSLDAEKKFKAGLKSVSEPLRKKAISTWTDGYKKAVSDEVFSPALPDIADRLAEASADEPKRAQGFRGRFRLSGTPADGGSDGQVKALEKIRTQLLANPGDSVAWVDYGNVLWGQGKPILAKIMYDYALSLNPKNPAALNNRAVVGLSGEGEEDWLRVLEGADLFQQAMKQEEFFLAAKINRGLLLSYYRLFPRAKALWEQFRSRSPNSDAEDGLGVALQGLGDPKAAVAAFKRAEGLGAAGKRFVATFHEAARLSGNGKDGAKNCLSKLAELDAGKLQGFEKSAVVSLKRSCVAWANQ